MVKVHISAYLYRNAYNSAISHCVASTAAELATDTTMRLFPRYARNTATTKAAAPLRKLSVLLRIAGKVIAVRQAGGK